MISLFGGALGCGLAILLCAGLRNAPIPSEQLKSLSIGPGLTVLLLFVAVLIGVFSSLVPAWGASRVSIVEALRSTD